jgi:hypothetical protein
MNEGENSVEAAIRVAETAINAALAALYGYEADKAYFDHLDAIYQRAGLLVESMKLLAGERTIEQRAQEDDDDGHEVDEPGDCGAGGVAGD